ncbi:hypothetical protein JSO19_00020 [Leucobacter sp. UCMA 4100]|uniref:hypothetical protein n=1 Tax=Leucobacter sp. UCMA 4100 TaxID=2810534 RepID=UPI0022EB7075|nr:hypothetical protein [Leucobacter sp. UCMA 4100]MDA3145763.1 hypothetical protein [Leucobacter sp. UCMA 4100]
MRKVWPIAAAVAVAVALSGCTPSQPEPKPSEPSSERPNLDSLTPAPPGVIQERDGEAYKPDTPAAWDDASRAAAVVAGETAMRAFARPQLDQETWWAELSPLLSDRAREDYAYVDPSAIPARKVTGSGTLTDDTSTLIATVTVPTDVGEYQVYVNRADGADSWRAARFIPPEGVK